MIVLLPRFGKPIQKKLIEWIKTSVPIHDSIMDVGCGNGQFLATLVSCTLFVSMVLERERERVSERL